MVSFIYPSFMLFVVVQRILETYSLPKRNQGTVHYLWSLYVLTILHVICIIGSILEFYLSSSRHDLSKFLIGSGLIMYFSGLVLRNWAKRSLVKYWSLNVEKLPDHIAIREGPYRFMRHPAYLAIMLEIIGIPLVANAFRILVFCSVPYVLVLVWRVHVEEKVLVHAIGWEYIRFQKEMPALLPWFNFDRRSRSNSINFKERRTHERRTRNRPVAFFAKKTLHVDKSDLE